MKTVLALAICFLLAPAAHAQDPTKIPTIVGIWKPTKGEIPGGATVEFTKDGKLKLTVTVSGQTVTGEATYKVEGDRITTTRLGPDGKEKADTAKIKKLTDKELVIEDDSQGQGSCCSHCSPRDASGRSQVPFARSRNTTCEGLPTGA